MTVFVLTLEVTQKELITELVLYGTTVSICTLASHVNDSNLLCGTKLCNSNYLLVSTEYLNRQHKSMTLSVISCSNAQVRKFSTLYDLMHKYHCCQT